MCLFISLSSPLLQITSAFPSHLKATHNSSKFCEKELFSHKTSNGSWGSKASSQAEERQAKLSCDMHSTHSAWQQLPVNQCIYN